MITIGYQIGLTTQTLTNISVHFGYMLDNLGNHLCDNEGNYFTLQ